MKSLIKCTLLLLVAASSTQASTLIFTSSVDGRIASGFGDASGNIGSGLIWGVVVDGNGNGFASNEWDNGFTYTGGNTTGIVLVSTTTGLPTDDILYLNTTVTSNLSSVIDGAAIGSGRVNSITSVTFGGLVGGGENFGIVWFDRGIALGSGSLEGQKYGFTTNGTSGSPAFILPTGNGDTVDYSVAFAGSDPVKLASNVLGIPETSTALLGALGVLGLLRRRR